MRADVGRERLGKAGGDGVLAGGDETINDL
jgi:hypothetical protein